MGIEPTIYRTRDEHANDYTTDGGQPTIYRTRDEHANDYTTDGGSNPRSTALETSTLTITPPMGGQTHNLPHSRRARLRLHHRWGVKPTIYSTRDEHAKDYTTDGGSNPRSTALETSTLTITPPMGGRTYDLPHSR